MTRRDYVLLANVINARLSARPDQEKAEAYRLIANDLADALATDNPRFDRARFLTACGVHRDSVRAVIAQLAEEVTA